jgi:hypothetical protein
VQQLSPLLEVVDVEAPARSLASHTVQLNVLGSRNAPSTACENWWTSTSQRQRGPCSVMDVPTTLIVPCGDRPVHGVVGGVAHATCLV